MPNQKRLRIDTHVYRANKWSIEDSVKGFLLDNARPYGEVFQQKKTCEAQIIFENQEKEPVSDIDYFDSIGNTTVCSTNRGTCTFDQDHENLDQGFTDQVSQVYNGQSVFGVEGLYSFPRDIKKDLNSYKESQLDTPLSFKCRKRDRKLAQKHQNYSWSPLSRASSIESLNVQVTKKLVMPENFYQPRRFSAPCIKGDRVIKSEDQWNYLWKIFQEQDGALPNNKQITQLVFELQTLSKSQIYKWFWDTKKRVKEISALGVDGQDGKGKNLTRNQIKNALKKSQNNKDLDIDTLASEIDLQIDDIAQELIDLPSPTGSRQIVSQKRQGANSGLF